MILMALLDLLPTVESQYKSKSNLKLYPPSIVGRSNHSSTHFWFPTNMAIVWDNSTIVLDARLADDCSDYYCNKTITHKPSHPSHQVMLSTDGGQTFSPQWVVSGNSPWDASTESNPFLGPCVVNVSGNTQARLVLYQGQIKAPWTSRAVLYTLDPHKGLQWTVHRGIHYHGVDTQCHGGHMWNQAVIAHHGLWLLSAQCVDETYTGRKKSSSALGLVFESKDGYEWNLRSHLIISAASDMPECSSPGENSIVEDSRGGILLFARCGSGLPLLAWRSTDSGQTWSRHPLPSTIHGVMPVAIRFENGAIVLATGRGGLALYLNAEGDGMSWSLTNAAKAHNTLISGTNMNDLNYTEGFVAFNQTRESTAYSTLRALTSDTGIFCYDRLSWSTLGNSSSWVGPPGNRAKNDYIFCMKFLIH